MSEARFLVLEDHPATARGLARQVRAHGLPVVAGSVQEAIRALDDGGRWSGLLLDVGLPDGSGLDVLAHDRKTHPTTPALVLTGDTERETINTAHGLGAAYHVKPVELKVVERFLVHAIETGFAARVERVIQAWMDRYNLSPAGADVLRRAALGDDRGAIASGRHAAESTVKHQIANILDLTKDESWHAAVTRFLREVAES